MMNKKLWLACLFVAGIMLTACGGDDTSDPTPSKPDTPSGGGDSGGGGSSSGGDSGTTTDDETWTGSPADLKRVSVHDPSVVWDPDSKTYYIFGSHRANARSTNLMTWVETAVPWAAAGTTNAANSVAFINPAVTKVKKGGKEYDLKFNAMAWSARGGGQGGPTYSVDGNMWAPDVIYNKKMQKWCMYLSINGDAWYSSIILLTADKITGPYLYQAPVVISGFHTGTAYKDTDLEIVLGEQASLPTRYAGVKNWATTGKPSYPNCIDPCVFYDEDGRLWMAYGSWSGGLFMLELDEETGLRDYDVTYAENANSDPYFGTKIAGGYYVSGEASYIEYIEGYYYLFVTYGGLDAAGGYQMRVFRSKSPDGPYIDSKNATALYTGYLLNFGAKANDNNRGVNIFGAYGAWGDQLPANGGGEHSGERSQGHNSVIAAEDGRAYLVYHTRFQNWGEGHQVRVHQLFQNQDGWLVAAPFEYSGEPMTTANIGTKQYVAKDKVPGAYKLLVHNYKLNNDAKELAKPVEVTLNSDGSITGAVNGTWSLVSGTSYININIGSIYKGVMVMQMLENTAKTSGFTTTPCFTALDATTGVTIWGYRYGD